MTAASTRPATVVVDLDAIRGQRGDAPADDRTGAALRRGEGRRVRPRRRRGRARREGAPAPPRSRCAVVEEGVVLRRSRHRRADPRSGGGSQPPASRPRSPTTCRSRSAPRRPIAAASGAARDLGAVARLHLKVDTGMHRIGAAPDEVVALARRIVDDPALRLDAVWTHLAVADEPERPDTEEQEERFADGRGPARGGGHRRPDGPPRQLGGLDRAPDGPA